MYYTSTHKNILHELIINVSSVLSWYNDQGFSLHNSINLPTYIKIEGKFDIHMNLSIHCSFLTEHLKVTGRLHPSNDMLYQ